MTRIRGRVKLARIVNESKRKAAFKRRKEGLIKSLNAISVLCGAEVCMVICERTDDQGTNNMMSWPSREIVEATMSSFMSLPEEQRKKKAVSHRMFLDSLLAKKYKQLQSLRAKNNHMEMEEVLRKFADDPASIEPRTGKLARLFLYLHDMIAKMEENERMFQSETNVNLV